MLTAEPTLLPVAPMQAVADAVAWILLVFGAEPACHNGAVVVLQAARTSLVPEVYTPLTAGATHMPPT